MALINVADAWHANNSITGDRELITTETQKFATELQAKAGEISFKSPTLGAGVIAYTGPIDEAVPNQPTRQTDF